MGPERKVRGTWLGIFLLVLAIAPTGFAQVTTERPGSILFFPKVIATGTRDTLIQISNVSNSVVNAHCFYVDAALTFPTLPPSPTNLPRWQEVDFDITLTKQQPTHWIVSLGRNTNPFVPQCSFTPPPGITMCNDAGLEPGRVPPVPPDFVGELKCIEVDSSGAPISGNHLKGEATLVVVTDATRPGRLPTDPVLPDPSDRGDASKYNAVAVPGFDTNDADNTLCLGGGITARCRHGAEYAACPQVTLLNSFASGANNPQLATPPTNTSTVTTELTIVPCSEDFENQSPASVVVQFLVYNEFEENFSTSTTVTCWANFELSQVSRIIFTVGIVGSRFLHTRMKPATDAYAGFVAVSEEFHHVINPTTRTARAAFNLHTIGQRANADVIVIPGGL